MGRELGLKCRKKFLFISSERHLSKRHFRNIFRVRSLATKRERERWREQKLMNVHFGSKISMMGFPTHCQNQQVCFNRWPQMPTWPPLRSSKKQSTESLESAWMFVLNAMLCHGHGLQHDWSWNFWATAKISRPTSIDDTKCVAAIPFLKGPQSRADLHSFLTEDTIEKGTNCYEVL